MFNFKRKSKRNKLFKRPKTQITSSRAAFRRTRKKFKKTHPGSKKNKSRLYLILISTLVLFLIYLFYFSSQFLLQEINVKNQELESTELATEIKNFSAKYLEENLTSLDTISIENELKTQFKQLETIKVSKNYPKSLEIDFTKYPLVANVIYEGNSLRKNYLINFIGYPVAEDLENTNLLYIRIKSEEPVNPDKPLIEANHLRYILESATYFNDKFGMNLTEIEYKPIAREVHLLTERNFYIWLDVQRSFEEQLKKLKKALVKLDIYTQQLEYIDLRIAGQNGEKIIYK